MMQFEIYVQLVYTADLRKCMSYEIMEEYASSKRTTEQKTGDIEANES